MKRIQCAALLLCLLLGGCGSGPQKYTAERYDLFDTLIFVTAYSESRESFDQMAQLMFEEFQRLHGLFDIYGDGSEGLSRLNAHAGGAAVEVEPEVMQLLKLGKDGYDLTDGKVNIAMGAVLKLWSQARENAMNDEDSAAPPSMESLQEFARSVSLMPEILADGINEKALETAEDTVIEFSDCAEVFEDYRKDLERVMLCESK